MVYLEHERAPCLFKGLDPKDDCPKHQPTSNVQLPEASGFGWVQLELRGLELQAPWFSVECDVTHQFCGTIFWEQRCDSCDNGPSFGRFQPTSFPV